MNPIDLWTLAGISVGIFFGWELKKIQIRRIAKQYNMVRIEDRVFKPRYELQGKEWRVIRELAKDVEIYPPDEV